MRTYIITVVSAKAQPYNLFVISLFKSLNSYKYYK